MLLEDYVLLEEPPPYVVVIEDLAGHPLVMLFTDGTSQVVGSSNVGKADKDGTVVWDGAKPDPMPNGHTKGRLLPVKGPRYVDSLTIYSYLATQTVEDYDTQQAQAKKRSEYGIKEPA
jgi:hypothetical protein